jgi:hypothetical protein
LEVDVWHVRGKPRSHWLAIKDVEAAKTHICHPLRFALPPRDLLDNPVREAFLRGKGIFDFIAPAEAVLTEV